VPEVHGARVLWPRPGLERDGARRRRHGWIRSSKTLTPNPKAGKMTQVELRASPGWEPINTAPRDGTRFLAVDATGEIGIARRHDPGGGARNPRHHYECWVTDFNSPRGRPLTHWMPLPGPPALKVASVDGP
jgi:hypothetical protein